MAIDKVIRTILLLTLMIQGACLSAQYQVSALTLYEDPHRWYDSALGLEKTNLILGNFEPVIRSARYTHQFFEEDYWSTGSFKYRGEVYDSLSMMYNIESDIIIFQHPTELFYASQPIKPIQNEVEWFSLRGHFFRYYHEGIFFYGPGFYDELFIGEELKFIVKRIKEQSIVDTQLEFLPANKLLLHYQGAYHRIKSKRSVIRVLKPYKKNIKRYVSENDLVIKTSNEQDILKLIRYCDQLLTSTHEPN